MVCQFLHSYAKRTIMSSSAYPLLHPAVAVTYTDNMQSQKVKRIQTKSLVSILERKERKIVSHQSRTWTTIAGAGNNCRICLQCIQNSNYQMRWLWNYCANVNRPLDASYYVMNLFMTWKRTIRDMNSFVKDIHFKMSVRALAYYIDVIGYCNYLLVK